MLPLRRLFSRGRNALRAFVSYAWSKAGVYRVNHLPVFVSVEPANFCQLACLECPVGMSRKEPGLRRTTLSKEHFATILKKVSPYVHTMQFFFQGEPLLNDALPEMIRMAHDEGLYTIVSTNAQRLDAVMAERLVQAGLSRIIVSMDGWAQASYEQYRQGGDVERCKQAVQWLHDAKQRTGSRMTIELQCLYLKTNEHEWEVFRREYKHLGADRLTMKTAQLYDYAHGNPLMPSDSRYARYKWDDTEQVYRLKRTLKNSCRRLWTGCVIDVEGNVLPCCFDKKRQYVFGNILTDDSLSTIWHGAKAEAFRRHILQHRADIPICTNCEGD